MKFWVKIYECSIDYMLSTLKFSFFEKKFMTEVRDRGFMK